MSDLILPDRVIEIAAPLAYEMIVKSPNGGTLNIGTFEACKYVDRFDVICYCAKEFQPPPELVKQLGPTKKLKLIYAPNDDRPAAMTNDEVRIAFAAAMKVSREYQTGKQVLIACAEGRNRSGLIAAMAIHGVYGVGGKRAIEMVRSARKMARTGQALTNPHFVKFLEQLKATDMGNGPVGVAR